MPPAIAIDRERIAEFCEQHHIRKLSLFGSVLRDDFGPDSDVDVLVEFEEGHVPGLMGLVGMEQELSDIIGREVDMLTPGELKDRVRKEASQTSEAIYGH